MTKKNPKFLDTFTHSTYGSIKKFNFVFNDEIPSLVRVINEEIIQPFEREICEVYNLSSINDVTEDIVQKVYQSHEEGYEKDTFYYQKLSYTVTEEWFENILDKNPEWSKFSGTGFEEEVSEPEPSQEVSKPESSEDEEVRDALNKYGDYLRDNVYSPTEVSKPKDIKYRGDPVKVFDWDKYYKYEDQYTVDILSDVEDYVCRYYEVDTFKDLTQEMIDSVSWYFEKYGPSGVGLGFHLSEEVKVFVRKVNQYLHTTDEWDDDDGDWNYRSRGLYLPIK